MATMSINTDKKTIKYITLATVLSCSVCVIYSGICTICPKRVV